MGANPDEKGAPFLREEALERVGGDADFLDELLALFEQEYASKMAMLERALAEGNMTAARELGHNLKGAAANLSLPGLQEAAWEMETAGKSGDLEKARGSYGRLKSEYARLKAYLG